MNCRRTASSIRPEWIESNLSEVNLTATSSNDRTQSARHRSHQLHTVFLRDHRRSLLTNGEQLVIVTWLASGLLDYPIFERFRLVCKLISIPILIFWLKVSVWSKLTCWHSFEERSKRVQSHSLQALSEGTATVWHCCPPGSPSPMASYEFGSCLVS